MSVYKEILREILTKGPGLNTCIISSWTSKKEIKTFSKSSFFPVLIFSLEFSNYLKKKIFSQIWFRELDAFITWFIKNLFFLVLKIII
jgi:hypothetical protein